MAVIWIPQQNRQLHVSVQTNLLTALIQGGIFPDAPCGGNGTCGKCRVFVNGAEVLACKTIVDRDMTVILPDGAEHRILREGICPAAAVSYENAGYLLAFDIGTTSLVCFLLDGKTGAELAGSSMRNPQVAFGGDVISRIQAALGGKLGQLSDLIRSAMTELIQRVCGDAGILPEEIGVISVVGNPAMQQLFLGIGPENLSRIPFAPVLTKAEAIPAGDILPVCPNGQLLIVPDISGYVGADTIGCLLASGLHEKEEITLLVDIGTNGEMVLGNHKRMIACATAAGPALEGAGIRFGMRAGSGAIDHVWLEKGEIRCSVIGGGEARGICGSGLIDAAAVGLELGQINKRGRILTEDHILHLTETVFLTQEDIRQLQLAKGAIYAGIDLMAKQWDLKVADIQKVQLAGAFGSFLNPENACRIGLLPEELLDRIEVIGNGAGSGAKMLACDKTLLPFAEELAKRIEFLELAALPAFSKCFARAMLFREEASLSGWVEKAKTIGFDTAVVIEPQTLEPREDVRAMCAQDKCGAYHKNWTCPPAVGTIEACRQKLHRYQRGILLQTIGRMNKTIDSGCYRETERRHLENFRAFAEEVRREYPNALCLGAGGCRVCKKCAYPEPCRFPEKAMSSMEGYGLFVTQVCRDGGVPYYYGEKTVTYTACVLF